MEDQKQTLFNLVAVFGFFVVAWFIFFNPPLKERPTGTDRLTAQLTRAVATDTASGVAAGQFSNFNMAVTGAEQVGETIVITTTGARYVLSRTGMELWRRIDPRTNTVNPRKVATLTFGDDFGPLAIEVADNSQAIVQSPLARFEFMSDSLFFITAKSPFTYTHTNLIANAPWNKGDGLNRMWTDGYGGSLHAKVSGNSSAVNNPDATTITMAAGEQTAHMAFPPKLFDFEALYGANSRPFVHFVYSPANINSALANLDDLKNDGFGVITLFALYDFQGRSLEAEVPVVLSDGTDRIGYEFLDENLIRNFIAQAHANGFKVITYMTYPSRHNAWKYPAGHPRAGERQDIAVTLDWMKGFQQTFGLDGWYFDNADVGGLSDDYNFIRRVRTDVGDRGIIYHHDSVDVWGSWLVDKKLEGLRAVFVDAYVNYTLAGETGEIAKIKDPNDPYLRFFASGYGMSQAFGDNKLRSAGDTAITEGEKERTMTENLRGLERTRDHSWLANAKPAYEAKKREYLAGTMAADVAWPIDPSIGWFRKAKNVKIIANGSTEAIITWETNELSDSEIIWTSSEKFKPPDGRVADPIKVTDHRLIASPLIAGADYKFRIRSRNGEVGLAEVVWGYVSGDQNDSPPPIRNTDIVSITPNAPTPILPTRLVDTTSPQTITNLQVTAAESKSATFTWTAPYGDWTSATSGLVASYDLRYARDPITAENWASTAPASGEPDPLTPGQTQTYVLVNLGVGQTYHAAIKSRDAAGNVSALSNLIKFTTNQNVSSAGTTSPGSPTILTSYGFDHQAILNWRNPAVADFVRTLVLRSTGPLPVITSPGNPHYLSQTPPSAGQATTVYDGQATTFIDTNLVNGQSYYYTLYAYDRTGNYSQPVTTAIRAAGGRRDLILQLMRRLLELLQQLLVLTRMRTS